MASLETRPAPTSPSYAFFTPSGSQYLASVTRVRWIPTYKRILKARDLTEYDYLLVQNSAGEYYGAYQSDILKNESEITLLPCSINGVEARRILRKRILCIASSDPRLWDFELLSNTKLRPIFFSELSAHGADTTDWVSTFLSSCREVHIFGLHPNGEKFLDSIKSADYWRAKNDLRRDPENTTNMMRFCKRLGPVGEGPSGLDLRICWTRTRLSFSTVDGDVDNDLLERLPELEQNAALNKLLPACGSYDGEGYSSVKGKGRSYSATYLIMKLAGVSESRLAAEQHKHQLKHARREKKPERPARSRRVSLQPLVEKLWRVVERKRAVSMPVTMHSTESQQGSLAADSDEERRFDIVDEVVSLTELPVPLMNEIGGREVDGVYQAFSSAVNGDKNMSVSRNRSQKEAEIWESASQARVKAHVEIVCMPDFRPVYQKHDTLGATETDSEHEIEGPRGCSSCQTVCERGRRSWARKIAALSWRDEKTGNMVAILEASVSLPLGDAS